MLNNVNLKWLAFVKNTLDNLGLSNYWLQQHTGSFCSFKRIVEERLKDHFVQKWFSSVNDLSKCLNYRMFKHDLTFEKYLNIIPSDLSNILCKFRCINHKLPIEKGRFMNIERNARFCQLCNSDYLGDEFHYLFICTHFTTERKKYLNQYYFRNPNSIKFSQLMNSEDRNTLLKLALFCKKIMSLCT